jgi:hypothetical protein
MCPHRPPPCTTCYMPKLIWFLHTEANSKRFVLNISTVYTSPHETVLCFVSNSAIRDKWQRPVRLWCPKTPTFSQLTENFVSTTKTEVLNYSDTSSTRWKYRSSSQFWRTSIQSNFLLKLTAKGFNIGLSAIAILSLISIKILPKTLFISRVSKRSRFGLVIIESHFMVM